VASYLPPPCGRTSSIPGVVLLCLITTLCACSFGPRGGGYFEDDGPDARARDVSRIPDATPRSEPLSASGNKPYVVYGKTYYPVVDAKGYREKGVASWYGKKFHGRRTSSGEPYDMYTMTAAHKTLPLPCYARVRNLSNGQSVIVRVNDRGPFLHNRLIDLSYAAAARLGIVGTGTGIVEVEAVGPDYTPAPVPAVTAGTGNASAETPVRRPIVELIPAANAAPPAGTGVPLLYLQVGAFGQWDNAANLRTRLERAGYRPIFIQSVLAEGESAQRLYRVRVGPVASVEDGDRLTQQLEQFGIADAHIVVE
jgi:rare lipoprotein A